MVRFARWFVKISGDLGTVGTGTNMRDLAVMLSCRNESGGSNGPQKGSHVDVALVAGGHWFVNRFFNWSPAAIPLRYVRGVFVFQDF